MSADRKFFFHGVTLSALEAKGIFESKQSGLVLPALNFDGPKTEPAKYARMRVGDLIWVREPFNWYITRDGMDYISYGTPGRGTLPDIPGGIAQRGMRVKFAEASAMGQGASRLTLVVRTVRNKDAGSLTRTEMLSCGLHETAGIFRPVGDSFSAISDRDIAYAWEQFWDATHRRKWFETGRVLVVRFDAFKENVNTYVKRMEAANVG